MSYRVVVIVIGAISIINLSGCSKEWTNHKYDQSQTVPDSVSDAQYLLNNSNIFDNGTSMGEIGAGDLYTTYANWQATYTNTERNCYIWAPDIYQGETGFDWDEAYQQIFTANVALELLASISHGANSSNWNNVEGEALFFRGAAFYDLSQLFCKAYDSLSAGTDLGIPLRLKSDVKATSVRSTVKATYEEILADLTQSASLLSATIPAGPLKTLPSKAAAFGVLARVYLNMENYAKASLYADSCLKIQNYLLDYNTLDSTQQFPLAQFNDEVVFYREMGGGYALINSYEYLLVDSSLYLSYSSDDLRHVIYFKPNSPYYTFYGGEASIDGNLFGGIKTDEMFLIRAECNARAGNIAAAMSDLNTVIASRYRTGTFTPYSATGSADALQKVLTECRKELCFRDLRWSYLRRLNKDPDFAITLTHYLNGNTYTLPPNSDLYIMPIAQDELQISHIQQNTR